MPTRDAQQAIERDRVNAMANGDGWSQGDREELGVLRTRMSNVERAIQSVDSNLATLAAKFDKKSEIPWQALGVMLAFVGMIGGALYWPIREGQSELKIAMVEFTKTLGKEYVTIRELDNRSARTTDERKRMEHVVDSIQKELVPRSELAERWRSFDKQFEYQQRQLDDRKRFESDMVSVPSFLKDMNERLRAMEIQRARSP
jgi:hypothetical protein